MKINHPLMHNNFLKSDFKQVIKLLNSTNPILTQNKNVAQFEKKWSSWLGVKYSTFVNSGSSANFLTIALLKIFLKKNKLNIIVPSLTWNSDIVSILKNNCNPFFVDINLNNLCANEQEIVKLISKNKIDVLFITHALGFNGLTKNIISLCKKQKIIIIEDVCESHGAKYKTKKLGSIGLVSNFSFYYAHHMSTIEGGMISTNNYQINLLSKMLRSHGLLREIKIPNLINKLSKKHKSLSKEFIFLHEGFNMRNNEINALIGLEQLKRLDKQNKKRSENFNFFLKHLDSSLFFVDFKIKGSSNYAFPLILKKSSFKLRDKLESLMKYHNIEFRRGGPGGGNQLRQPYLKKLNTDYKNFQNTEHMHNFGYYIGNYPSLKKRKIKLICSELNKLKV